MSLAFYLLVLCASGAAAPVLPINHAGSVCNIPDKFSGARLVSFEHVDVHAMRMFFELYYDRPLLVRSFFHACPTAGAQNSFLLVHQVAPTSGTATIYPRQNLSIVVEEACFDKTKPQERQFCAAETAREYARHLASVVSVVGLENIVFIDDSKLWEIDYAERAFALLEEREFFGPQQPFDAVKYLAVKRALSAALVTKKIAESGAQVPHVFALNAKRRAALTSIDFDAQNIKMFATFVFEWRKLMPGDSGNEILQSHFADIPLDSRLLARRLALMSDSEQCQSAMKPHVNVLMPTKAPKAHAIALCMRSLLQRANLQFGEVRFHFGIDWGDQKTQIALETICAAFNATCEVHQVHGRAGDVSVIANHLFAAVEEDEYFLRFNDDTEMLTQSWNELAIKALRQPPCDIGLAKIHDQTNHALQTHSFVSAMHKRIFGYYFAYHFKNWYEDNWITETYAGALTKPSSVVIKHHAKGVRYKMDPVDGEALKFAIDIARKKINRFLLRNNLALAK